jgi:ParB family transcriptional regulator, chromosome partitioning protein
MATAARRKPLSEVVPQAEEDGVRLLPLSALDLADKNVRRGGQAELEQLAADIQAHGVLQNLVGFEFEGKTLIVAGGRRLRALQLLKRQGAIGADYQVPVRVVPADDGRELSLAENFQRLAMGAGEEAEAFARLLGEGLEAEDIARRFGLTVLHVRQRLRLAGLAPVVLDALKAGKITLDVAKAFAAVPDQARQAHVLKNAGQWALSNADAIRREMQGAGYPASHHLCRLVGEADYVAAGGTIEGDLFTEAAEALWLDRGLIEKLAREKLTEVAEHEREAHGFGRVIPLLWWRELREQVEGLVPYSWPGDEEAWDLPADVRAQLVVTLELGADRGAETSGWQTALVGDRAWLLDSSVSVPAPEEDEEDDAEEDDGRFGEDLEDKAPEPEEAGLKPLPSALSAALAMRKRDALAMALIHDSPRGRDLGLFLICELAIRRDTYPHRADLGTGLATPYPFPDDPVKETPLPWVGDGLDRALDAARRGVGDEYPGGLDDGWLHLKSVADRWAAFLELPVEVRLHWGAVAVGKTLTAFGGHELKDAVAASMGLEKVGAAFWRPTAENYFDRAGKARCVQFLEDVFDGRCATTAWAKWKKADLASACEALAAGNAEKLGALGGADRATIEEAGRRWMPRELTFGGVA